MKVYKKSGPQRCTLCLRSREEAIRDHLQSRTPCCPQCPLGDVIRYALQNQRNDPGTSTGSIIIRKGSGIKPPSNQGRKTRIINRTKKHSNFMEIVKGLFFGLLGFTLCIVIGYAVYIFTSDVMRWDETWCIVSATIWPVTLMVGIFYGLFLLISGFF